MAANGVFWP
jgi:hypothetical protein